MRCECEDCPIHNSIDCDQPAIGRYKPVNMPDSSSIYLCANCVGAFRPTMFGEGNQ